ncbi:MAG: hypothetical protein WCW27_01700 [Patescibacteria group bacterium]|jgi:hypothetical protein
MSIPYYIFGIIYLVGLLVLGFFLLLNIYHIVRYGFFRLNGQLVTYLVLGVMLVILIATASLLMSVDWFTEFTIF